MQYNLTIIKTYHLKSILNPTSTQSLSRLLPCREISAFWCHPPSSYDSSLTFSKIPIGEI